MKLLDLGFIMARGWDQTWSCRLGHKPWRQAGSFHPTTTMSFLDLGTPVNTALLLYILYTVQRMLFPPTKLPESTPDQFKLAYSWMPKQHPPTMLYKIYTPKTLEPFNGRDGARILLAIDGIVFDVTAGRNFYGPGKRLAEEYWVRNLIAYCF